jgi:endonuclease YncB( thermonuclease family)
MNSSRTPTPPGTTPGHPGSSSRTAPRPVRGKALPAALLVFVLTALAVSETHPDIYTWTGEDGVRSYSNRTSSGDKGEVAFREQAGNPIADDKGHPDLFQVTAVYDGDTVKARRGTLTLVVRLVGIDTPETGGRDRPGQPFGRAAARMLERLVQGKEVRVKGYGTGGYNRSLGELFVGKTNVNLELVAAGLAEVYRGRLPKGFDAEPYLREEARARRLGLGAWSLGDRYESPRQWRLRHPRQDSSGFRAPSPP